MDQRIFSIDFSLHTRSDVIPKRAAVVPFPEVSEPIAHPCFADATEAARGLQFDDEILHGPGELKTKLMVWIGDDFMKQDNDAPDEFVDDVCVKLRGRVSRCLAQFRLEQTGVRREPPLQRLQPSIQKWLMPIAFGHDFQNVAREAGDIERAQLRYGRTLEESRGVRVIEPIQQSGDRVRN